MEIRNKTGRNLKLQPYGVVKTGETIEVPNDLGYNLVKSGEFEKVVKEQPAREIKSEKKFEKPPIEVKEETNA